MELKDLKDNLENRTEVIRAIIERVMPSKGDKEEDCQRLTLLNRLREFEFAINGIEPEDLIDDDILED